MKRYEYNYGKNPEGTLSTISGYATETTNFGETAFGILNKSTRDEENFTTPEVVSSSTATLFSVGNGTDNDSRKNIIELKANGTVYINGVGQYDGTNPGESTNIADEFQGIHDDITGLNEDVDRIDNTIESIHISEDNENLIYTLLVDGQERGTIHILRDQFLTNVSYNEETNNLEFTFIVRDENNEEVEKQVNVNMSDLRDIYSAGDGLDLENKQFSVKVDADTQPYIEVSANGVKLVGINEALDKKVSWDESKKVITLPADGSISALRNNGLEGGVLVCQRTYDEGATYVTEVGTTKNNLTLNSIERPKIDFADGTSENVAYESEITDISSSLDNYLPLSGGTLTGNVEMENAGLTINHGFLTVQDGLNGSIAMYPNFGMISLIAESVSNTIRIQKDISLAQGGYYPIAIDYSSEHPCIRINQHVNTTFDLSLAQDGITIKDKTENDLLNAAGGTVSIDDITSQVDLSGYLPLTGGTLTGHLTTSTITVSTLFALGQDTMIQNGSNGSDIYIQKVSNESRDNLLSIWNISNERLIAIRAEGIQLGYETDTNLLLNAAGSTTSVSSIVTQVQAAIVDSAPETLDTLNELAAALGDDPNFATTVTNQIASKVDNSKWDNLMQSCILTNIQDFTYTDDHVSFNHQYRCPATGQFGDVTNNNKAINAATSTTAGVMTAADKSKLDSIEIQDGDIIASGFRINDGTASEVLTADGDSNTLKTINGQTLLGSGNITTPTPTVNAASGTKTIWTGTQSEYEGVTTKDANTLYFITEG